MSKRPALSGALILCAALAGCSGGPVGTAQSGDAVVPDPVGMESWELPLDDYFLGDVGVIARAVSETYATCLRSAGVDVERVQVDIDSLRDAPTAVTNVYRRRLFSTDIARTYGYRYAAFDDLKDSQDPPDLPAIDSSPQASSCADQSASQFEELSSMPAQFSLAAGAYNAAKEDAAVVTAARRWRDCLQPETEFSLPDDPESMPTAEIGTWLGIGDDDAVRSVSAAEIAFATSDATCRERTRYTASLYLVERRLNARALEENRDILDKELARHRELLARAVEVLSSDTSGGG